MYEWCMNVHLLCTIFTTQYSHFTRKHRIKREITHYPL